MNDTSGVYRIKEDLLLKNFLDKSRKNKAKVLRLQQVKNYDAWVQSNVAYTLSRRHQSSVQNVAFHSSSLIQDAIKEGNKYEVLDLLSKGISINFNATQGEGMTLLHQACVYDDYIIAQALIKQDALLDLQDDYGCTPLHICCMWDSLKCAQLLVSNDASVNVLDIDGNFAVDLAPENSHLKAMMKKHMQQKLKIEESHLKNMRNKTQKTMLHDIRELLENGSSVDLTSSAGISLLHIAVTNGYVSAARMLLENSANVNAADAQLWTPLHCAAKYGQVKMVRLLLSHYANPHSRTTSGFIPREMAKDMEITNMLTNAEDTFLDLDNQKTPAKPKRFSASLLDQFDDEDDVTRVPSRIISSTRTSKRDILKEKSIINELGGELKQELNAEMEFHPPNVINSVGSSIPTWKQMMPPPLPPRDDPPGIDSPLSSPLYFGTKTKKYFPTNIAYDDAMLKAVVTIQRAYRRHRNSQQPSPLDVALQTLDDYGSSFYDEMVFQNAEDISKESDRQRSRKSIQRKSWSNDLRRNVRSSVTNRPLSTGILYMQMSHAPENTAVWLPQSGVRTDYSVPPDVIPIYQQPNKDYWNTLPGKIGRAKSLKQSSMGSTDSGVSLASNHKDRIELTKTVKHSLTVTDATSPRIPGLTRKASLPNHRPTSHPTYRMPPLTATVASLINTAAPTKKQNSNSRNGRKIMKQVEPTDYSDENPYAMPDDPEVSRFKSHSISEHRYPYGMQEDPEESRFKSHSTREHRYPYGMPEDPEESGFQSHSTREHRYGSLMSNRGSILRDARFQNLNQSDALANRHSWNGEQEESSTSFGRRPSKPPVHPIVSPAASSEMKLFTDDIPSSSSSPMHSAPADRRGSRQEGGPPPPPRRAPTTKLSVKNNGDERIRSNSMTVHNSNVDRWQSPGTPPPSQHSRTEFNNVATYDSSTDEDLPDVPPPLPLYTPQALTQRNSSQFNPNEADLPAPPPPDVLLCDTIKRMENRSQKTNFESQICDFPPPPPTL